MSGQSSVYPPSPVIALGENNKINGLNGDAGFKDHLNPYQNNGVHDSSIIIMPPTDNNDYSKNAMSVPNRIKSVPYQTAAHGVGGGTTT